MTESIEGRLIRLEQLVQGLIQRLDERCETRKDDQETHKAETRLLKDRVASLEQWRDQAKGGWMVLIAIVTLATSAGSVLGIVFYRLVKSGVL